MPKPTCMYNLSLHVTSTMITFLWRTIQGQASEMRAQLKRATRHRHVSVTLWLSLKEYCAGFVTLWKRLCSRVGGRVRFRLTWPLLTRISRVHMLILAASCLYTSRYAFAQQLAELGKEEAYGCVYEGNET